MSPATRLILIILCWSPCLLTAQQLALKTNMPALAVRVPNLSMEVTLGPSLTLDVAGMYNPFQVSETKKWKRWSLQPELRYWLCKPFSGTFIGLHGGVGQFNMGGIGGSVDLGSLGQIEYNELDVAGTGLSISNDLSTASLGVLWQTASGLVTAGTINTTTKMATITASATTGNAVIALYSGAGQTGTILWSWHIWVTDYDPNTPSNGDVYTYNSRTWMDRNLGATTITAAMSTTLGLMYQWGRKDPFPGSASFSTNTEFTTIYNATSGPYTCMNTGAPVIKKLVSASSNLGNTVLNPGTFYYGTLDNSYDWYSVTASTHNDALWGGANTTTPTGKTIFDPCPAGWRVPAWSSGLSPWNGFNTLNPSGTADTQDEYLHFPWYGSVWETGYGRIYNQAGGTYYPAAGYRHMDSGALAYVGSLGRYWSASPSSSDGYSLYFNSSSVYPSDNSRRAGGFAVRCVQE